MVYSGLQRMTERVEMAGDQRDWYRDWWRRKTGYVERAHFRLGEGERERIAHSRAWRRNWLVLLVVVLLIVGAKLAVLLAR